jgi:hypothetical protein
MSAGVQRGSTNADAGGSEAPHRREARGDVMDAEFVYEGVDAF